MPRRRSLFLLVPVLVVVLAAGYWYSQRAPASPVVGRPAPAFELRTLDGQAASLAGYRGRPVVVNFWATWCEPCKEEMPALQAQAASRPSLTILGVDNVEAAVKVRPFVQQHGLTYPILLDQDGSVVQRYQVIGMPTSFFIDRSGILRAVYRGALTKEIINQDLALIGA